MADTNSDTSLESAVQPGAVTRHAAHGRYAQALTLADFQQHLGAVRARIAADYPPSPGYDSRQAPSDLQNRESGLFGPVRIFARDASLGD